MPTPEEKVRESANVQHAAARRSYPEVERRLSAIDELETFTTANLTLATHRRQSILQQAFSGQL